jgi:RimJ/RimL family protein N-acetyltransferase/nucleotide-binding universal stress UspA family protein
LTDGSRTRLRDGSSVEIRPIEPEDRELLRSGFADLSERSRYLRFQSPLTELSDQQLSYLTVVDHHDHEALLAVDASNGDAVGVARFVRITDDVAECAIVVADEWHNRGLGSELLERLVERAHEEGIERFTALVLADNTDALRLLERLGDTVRRREGSQVELEIELPARPDASSQVRLILAAAARGLLVPATTMWRQVADFVHRRARSDAVSEPANVIVAHAFTTGDSQDAPVLTIAAELAAARSAHVHLVDSYWPVLSSRADVDKRLAAAADELRRRGISVTAHLHGGDTVDAVIDVAEETEAALIVIDPRAASQMTPWRAYSLPARVCARAPCDVLIARDAA